MPPQKAVIQSQDLSDRMSLRLPIHPRLRSHPPLPVKKRLLQRQFLDEKLRQIRLRLLQTRYPHQGTRRQIEQIKPVMDVSLN